MRYKQKTPHLGIPVVGQGDRIHPEMEMKRYTIIENMLIAGTQGVSEVVFDEGPYSIEEDGEEYVVTLKAGGTYPSIHGIVSGFYFKGSPILKWTGLKRNAFYYLYVKATSKTPHENSAIRLVSSTVRLGKGSLLVAAVDLKGEVAEIDIHPDGKIYSADVARHASDSSNPHGLKLEQEELVVTKELTISEEASVEIEGEKFSAGDFALSAAALVGRRIQVMDFPSAGVDGALLKCKSKVLTVHVSRRCTGSMDKVAGEIGVGYFGEDESVDSEKEFKVYNTGEEGIPLRALVICG